MNNTAGPYTGQGTKPLLKESRRDVDRHILPSMLRYSGILWPEITGGESEALT